MGGKSARTGGSAVIPEDLIAVARGLARGFVGGARGRPRQTDLCRATSAAYYAMFHTLARCCADTLVGATPAIRNGPAWTQTYRALEHGYAKNQCVRPAINRFPPEIREFAKAFSDMQRLRHIADYAPQTEFIRHETLSEIDYVERIIADFATAPAADRRAFSVYVLLRIRTD